MSQCRVLSLPRIFFATVSLWAAVIEGHGVDRTVELSSLAPLGEGSPAPSIQRTQLSPTAYAKNHREYTSLTVSASAWEPSSVKTRAYSTSSAAPAQTHIVQVGLADHKFQPAITNANVGDTVEFRFYPTNHSIVRAEYGYPCVPYEMMGSNRQGFFSGFHSMDKVLDNPPKFSLTINDTAPVFFYCSAPGSCKDWGMVGAINPNETATFETQRQLAFDSSYMLQPGEPFPDEAPRPSGISGVSGTSGTSSITPSPSHPATQDQARHHVMSTGAIAGVAAAGGVLVLLACVICFLFYRTRSLKRKVEQQYSKSSHDRENSISSTAQMIQPAYPHTPSPEPLLSPTDLPRNSYPPQQRQAVITPVSPTYQPQPQQILVEAPTPITTFLSPIDTSNRGKYSVPEPLGHPAFSPLTPTTHFPSAYDHSSHRSPLDTQTVAPFPAALSPHHLPPPTPSMTTPNPDTKLGPYGAQEAGRLGIGLNGDAVGVAAPPYGWHVNSQLGPAEMDASTAVHGARAGSPVRGDRVAPRSVPRWEEVGRRRGGGDAGTGAGRMF